MEGAEKHGDLSFKAEQVRAMARVNGPGEAANEGLLRWLQKPKGKVDVVLDTDTYNGIA
jgi:hypothetical protein